MAASRIIGDESEDPEVSKEADWVFICDVIHHTDRPAWLGRISAEMKLYEPAFDAHPASRAGWFDAQLHDCDSRC